MVYRFFRRLSRPWYYALVSWLVILGIGVGQPLMARAISWGDLILQGIQVVQLSNLSDKQEAELGGQINQQLVSGQVKLYRDPALNQYINQIGQRLAAKSDRPKISYTFQIVDDTNVNAFATMGGYVYVNRGLIRLADNEAQLASVIGHEIGHISGRHSVKQMRQMAIAQGVATATGLDRSAAVNIGVELALRRPNSRNDEFDADQRGLVNLGRAGYAQSAMVDFMQKLVTASATPPFLSTHPATPDRINRLKQNIRSSSGDGLDNNAYQAKTRVVR